jgi:replicative DNA helicase
VSELPYNADAERMVIAACYKRPDALALYGMQPMDFYLASHQQIYRAIVACRARETYSTAAIVDELRRTGDLDRVGGVDALYPVLGTWAPDDEADEAAALVKACATRRALIAAGSKIATIGYTEAGDLEDQIADAHAALTSATSTHHVASAPVLGDVIDGWFDMVSSDDGGGLRWRTGLSDLDDISGGLWASDLTVLAAATSVGKTALALSLADALIAIDAPVLWFSMEMPREQLINRMMSIHTGINAGSLRKRKLAPGDLRKIADAMAELRERPLIIDCKSRTLAQVRTVAQQQRAKRDQLALVVIDHMGLMRASNRYAGQRVHEVGELSRGLKELAMEMNAPILALHQFNRMGSSEADPTQVPLLSHLRDSGNVEQDADNVWLLHRPGTRSPNTQEQTKATLYIAKQRNGPVGSVALYYDPHTTHYRSVERYREVMHYDNH